MLDTKACLFEVAFYFNSQQITSIHSWTEHGVMIMMIFDILIWAPDIEVLTKIYVQAARSRAKTHKLLFH